MSILDQPHDSRRCIAVHDGSIKKGAPLGRKRDLWVGAAMVSTGAQLLSTLSQVVDPVFGVLLILGGKERVDRGLGVNGASPKSTISNVLNVTLEEVRDVLEFPPGHPIAEHVYVGHPLLPKHYLPLASFHRILFEEKVNELVNLLASLGATRVRVLHSTGYRRSGEAEAAIGEAAEAKASNQQEKKSEVLWEERYRPQGEPKLPDNLIWYGSEKSWQGLADRRIRFRTTTFAVKLNYSENYGVDIKLKTAVEKIGLKLSGQFADFVSTTWEFSGEFLDSVAVPTT
jgi:hypothetical protein